MADARIISGLTKTNRVDIYPLRRKLVDTAIAMQKQSGLTQYIETNSILDPHREPTSDEILGFSDDGGYLVTSRSLTPWALSTIKAPRQNNGLNKLYLGNTGALGNRS